MCISIIDHWISDIACIGGGGHMTLTMTTGKTGRRKDRKDRKDPPPPAPVRAL